ncbi:MAG TPA: DUF3108 domain-containing protein [Desulfopila sp.]|nr:DUF3108 domain-containing protein [Desulfopila sp.]
MNMVLSRAIFTAIVLVGAFVTPTASAAGADTAGGIPSGRIMHDIAAVAYAGGESFKYDISWTGGIKIGELHMQQKVSTACEECFTLDTLITSTGGIVHKLYPVRDHHVTQVRGDERLPYYSEIWQKQGRGYRAHKEIVYDQQQYVIIKKKEGDNPRSFRLDGKVHNEFSAFFASRVMNLQVGSPVIVPTFGDDKRAEVVVRTLEKSLLKDTLLGDVETFKVSPILTFSGLYDKKGDTLIWYTADECRVPIRVQSKIVIGSLTATLVEYSNAKCSRYRHRPPDFAGKYM